MKRRYCVAILLELVIRAVPAARLAAIASLEMIGRRENHEGTVKVEVFRCGAARAGKSRARLKFGIGI